MGGTLVAIYRNEMKLQSALSLDCDRINEKNEIYRPNTAAVGRCNSIAMFGYCHGVLPVCRLSVMEVHCDKATQAKITKFSLSVGLVLY